MIGGLDGVLVLDKPAGPTSHDMVARLRRALGISRVGHTGTLDPIATGVLPLVLGRATRLARFLAGEEKEYLADIRLGFTTDTDDFTGRPETGPAESPPARVPPADAIVSALCGFVGVRMQTPPAYSAKKVGGVRSYVRARRGDALRPAAVPVTVTRLDLISVDRDLVRVSVACSAGFYVRSLARDLGACLGTGAHLHGLRRVRSGQFTEDAAVTMEAIERDPTDAVANVVPIEALLDDLPSVSLTFEGKRRATTGQDIGPEDCGERPPPRAVQGFVRLVDGGGRLVAVAEPSARPGFLHPCIVLV